MKVGLYFGSFNPVHIGHLIIGSFVANHTDVEQVWFIVSPQNPLKKSSTLLNEYHRLYLVQLAVKEDDQLKASNIEFKMPRPSYTIDTLTYLKEKYPGNEFVVILGSDSYQNITKWKNYEILLKNYSFYVFRRPGYEIKADAANIKIMDAPLLEISSTAIRQNIRTGKSIRYVVPEPAREEIERNNYYKESLQQ